jgi:predicted SAM-dependent methyltransferase
MVAPAEKLVCNAEIMTSGALRRSQFVVGLAKALRGLARDLRVLVWLVKRNRRIEDYLRAHPVRKLQIAAGNNLLAGWLNTDVFLSHSPIVYLDGTKRFPFDDDTFHYIMAEHMIEHVEYEAGQAMLRECFRVLKPGGRVRVATPDLRVLLALHCREKTDIQRLYIDWAITRFMPAVREYKDVFVINNFFRAWGHRFLYDEETLRHALHTSGFRDITFYKPGDSADPILRNLESHGRELGSEDINQFETIVAEGCKDARSDSLSAEQYSAGSSASISASASRNGARGNH